MDRPLREPKQEDLEMPNEILPNDAKSGKKKVLK
jgi:hypothetical protein